MAEPFLGELRLMSFNFPPKGWAFCNGQLLPINQNQALFALLGTTFGGNGQTVFALPNLQGRVPIHAGDGFNLGTAGGEAAHTLTQNELPTHTHVAQASNVDATTFDPVNNLLAITSTRYTPASSLTTLSPTTNGSVGGSQAHLNLMPYQVLSWCIALQGIFPSQN